ncbi:hypothetical protein [Pandoraea sp. NPDC087047]|uniref:hypothetical protein n=1 Tax=Pandoraea sp. NPDC087047 TaxID=3364390 RepID=UPI003827A053
MKLTSGLSNLFSKSSSSDAKRDTEAPETPPSRATLNAPPSNMPPSRQSRSHGSSGNVAPRKAHALTISQATTHPLRPEQQVTHELQVGADKRVYQNGRRFSTGQWEESRYVMGADGKMYADRPDRQNGAFPDNHTSFLAGQQPAAAAGEITAHNGVIESLNDLSGHYAPTSRHTQQMLNELHERGVDTSSIQTSSWSGS